MRPEALPTPLHPARRLRCPRHRRARTSVKAGASCEGGRTDGFHPPRALGEPPSDQRRDVLRSDHEAHQRPEAVQRWWPDQIQPGDRGLEAPRYDGHIGVGAQRSSQRLAEEIETVDVRPVAGRRNNVIRRDVSVCAPSRMRRRSSTRPSWTLARSICAPSVASTPASNRSRISHAACGPRWRRASFSRSSPGRKR